MTKSMLAFGLGMLGAGLAVGYLAHPEPPAAVAPAAPPTLVAGDAKPASAPAAPSAERSAPGGAPAPGVAAPDGATGDGAIAGCVTGPDGVPLEGVLVRAHVSESGPGVEEEETPLLPPGAPPPRRDIAREVRDFAARLERAEAGLRETTTDASGRYAFSGLGAKSYSVEAWLVGYRIERTGGIEWQPVPVGGRCDFRATPVRWIPVSVLLPDGKPPEQARISWKPLGGGDEGSGEWKPSRPGIELEPGTYEFTASTSTSGFPSFYFSRGRRRRFFGNDGDEALYHCEPQMIAIGAGESPTLVFQLAGRPGIQVKVSYASPEHPRSARIAALKMGPGVGTDSALLVTDGRVRAAWIEGEKNEGTLVGLDPGTYLVGVTFRGGQVGPTATVVVADRLVTQELQVPAGEIRDWVRLWVRAPDGTPVADAEIAAGCRSGEGTSSGEVGAKPEADGSYRIEHYEEDAPSLGGSWSSSGDMGSGTRTYFLEITSKRFGKAETNYDPLKDREVTVQFSAPAVLRATITGYAASPDKDRAILTLESREDGDRGDDEDGDIDPTGAVKFAPVKPGKYEVVLRLAPNDSRRGRHMSRWRATEITRVPVTLGPGEATVAVPFQTLAELVVTYEGEVPSLLRVGADGVPRTQRSGRGDGKNGEIAFRDIPSGRYLLQSRVGVMWVDVPAPGPVAFQPSPYNAYHLEVREKSYLRDLGLKTGDLVVGIDGVEFTDRPSMDAALAASKTRESSKFTILRDGQRFDVAADGKRFEEDDGSYYQPWVR